QAIITPALRTRTADDWVTALREAGVPCGAVRSVGDALTDPQTLARQMVELVTHPTIGPLQVLGVPAKLSDTPGRIHTAPPLLGQHTAAVLRDDAGFDEERIARMVATGAART